MSDLHALTIYAPNGGSWHSTLTTRQADAIWRYLRIVGAPMVTAGIGAGETQQGRHGDTSPPT